MTSCQLIYLSNCFYSPPSFLYTSVKSFDLVSGGWSLFHLEEDKELLLPITDQVNLSPSFSRTSRIVGSILLCSAILWLVFTLTQIIVKKKNIKATTDNGCTSKFPKNLARFIYKAVIFPLATGFLIMIQLSGCMNLRRLSII